VRHVKVKDFPYLLLFSVEERSSQREALILAAFTNEATPKRGAK